LLAGFISATQHNDQHAGTLHVIHSPAGAKKLAHFKYCTTHRLYIAQVTQAGFSKPGNEPALGQSIPLTIKPCIKLGCAFDSDHLFSVAFWLRTGKLTVGLLAPLLFGTQMLAALLQAFTPWRNRGHGGAAIDQGAAGALGWGEVATN
jgi:hypothetical protein